MRLRCCKPATTGALVAAALLAGLASSGRADEGRPTAYIDAALPANLFMFRFDSMYNDNRPDRAEVLYPQYKGQVPFTFESPSGSGQGKTRSGRPTTFVNSQGQPVAPTIYRGRGLAFPETSVDLQQLSAYLELKACDQLSGFIEVPERFLNPVVNDNSTGYSDMNAGFKFAFLESEGQVATFQLRTYAPTGFAGRGLGNGHVSLEPALLFYQRLSDHLVFNAELRDWIPIGGTDFEGNVLRYGVGVTYQLYQRNNLTISPVAEFVGWTVLGGKESVVEPLSFDIQDATGDTIINAKVGAIVRYGEHNEIYMGYGRAMTGAVWYKDMLRIEYRLLF